MRDNRWFPVRAGFVACSPDYDARVTAEQARARLAEWRATPLPPGLRALTASAHGAAGRLSISTPAGSAQIALDRRTRVVHTARPALDARLTSTREWSSAYGNVLAGVLPKDAFIAYLGDEDWSDAPGTPSPDFVARAYLLREGAAEVTSMLSERGHDAAWAVGCGQPESGLRRASFRVEVSEGVTRRVHLTILLHYGDYGDDAHVDLRVANDVAGGTLVLACLYRSDGGDATCNALASSLRRLR